MINLNGTITVHIYVEDEETFHTRNASETLPGRREQGGGRRRRASGAADRGAENRSAKLRHRAH